MLLWESRAGGRALCSHLPGAIPASLNVSAIRGIRSAGWLALFNLNLLFLYLCDPCRRDAELSIPSGCQPLLCGPVRALTFALERDDVNGANTQQLRLPIAHTSDPLHKKNPSFMMVSACTYAEGLMLHHLRKDGSAARPGGW